MSKRDPVLIANRGEIALRVAHTARRLGFPTVAVYSDADRFSEHVEYCDLAVHIGGPAPKDSYLNIERVIAAAKKSGAKYIHPGYGFLSERPAFVEACVKAGFVFVGPSASAMRLMGDKIQARSSIDALKIPRVPGSPGAVKSAKEAARFGAEVGFPILLKAAAGGGGKGMRLVSAPEELQSAFEGATREAESAFGDGSLYVEKFIVEPHHVEVQVFGDGKGHAIHLGERECSIQRRHQKVWEESPSPLLKKFPKTGDQLYASAVKIAEHVKYAGAGTIEFIVDGKGHYYFLEVNTRLQVEHPVTEWVTGADLVAWQLALATGELKLPAVPERRGHSIEVRLYAEDPRNFLPAPGPIGEIHFPSGPFIRVDSAFTRPGEISMHYDPMIAKISVWGETRDEAIDRLRVALDETRVEPPLRSDRTRVGSLKTNLSFLRKLTRNKMVQDGNTPTDLIARNPDLTSLAAPALTREAALALALYGLANEGEGPGEIPAAAAQASPWAQLARKEVLKP